MKQCSTSSLAANGLSGYQCNALRHLLIHVRVQNTHKREIAIALGKVQPVADHKKVGDLESDIIGLDLLGPAGSFVQENARFDPPGFERLKLAEHAIKRLAGIEDIIDEEDVAAANVQAQFLGEDQ